MYSLTGKSKHWYRVSARHSKTLWWWAWDHWARKVSTRHRRKWNRWGAVHVEDTHPIPQTHAKMREMSHWGDLQVLHGWWQQHWRNAQPTSHGHHLCAKQNHTTCQCFCICIYLKESCYIWNYLNLKLKGFEVLNRFVEH